MFVSFFCFSSLSYSIVAISKTVHTPVFVAHFFTRNVYVPLAPLCFSNLFITFVNLFRLSWKVKNLFVFNNNDAYSTHATFGCQFVKPCSWRLFRWFVVKRKRTGARRGRKQYSYSLPFSDVTLSVSYIWSFACSLN